MTKGVIVWLRNILKEYCALENVNFMKLLLLDLPKVEKKKKNVCLLLTTTYILYVEPKR